MSLSRYHKKRHFGETPEPKGTPNPQHGKRLAFVIQEHHASRLHYDFRLELDGVLKSWAVPKGPSMNPHDRHLAVHVEDHPYEYRNFEGVIPEGNYGAGEVIIWDEGWYEPRADTTDPEKTLRQEFKKGHLTIVLHGKKLHGEFALIKMHGRDDNAWLLIKKGDEYASSADITLKTASVKSGRNVDDLAEGEHAVTHLGLAHYPHVAKPWTVHPMLCTLVDEPFNGDEWLFEVKWDGYRAIGTKHGEDVQLYSRAGTDFNTHYPPIAEAVRGLKHDVILDGEIVVVDGHGRPHFEWLQTWRTVPQGHLHYYVFDILWCDGHDVRTMPLAQRKKLLASVIPPKSPIHYSDHVAGKGLALYHEMQRRGLEGVVAKKADSTYRENDRGAAWLKIKTHLRQEVVIGGFTEPRGSRTYIGSLIVGLYEDDKLVYVGHSGGGIPGDQRKALRERLERLERKTSPFVVTPKPNAPAHWVRPELVCEMSFSEWTSEGSMRQPQFEGLRTDKKPQQVVRELPKKPGAAALAPAAAKKEDPAMPDHTNSQSTKLELTHLDKVFFPKHKYTKGDMINYYRSVADVMLPYLKDRPHSLYRMPGGITDEGFFQKNMEHLPPWVPHADIYSESNQAKLHWLVGGKLDTLLYMVQLGCVEINPWNSRMQHLGKPDWIVIDLDPEGVTFKDVVTVAREVKTVCDEWSIAALPKTSGKTGIHIYIPLHAQYDYEQAKNFAHLIALEVNKRLPKLTSVLRLPEKRRHRIYLDFLQNREGQTLAAPYSLRPTPDATVSMPLHWDEVVPALKPTNFTIKNAHARLADTGDLWKPVLQKGVNLRSILKRIEAET